MGNCLKSKFNGALTDDNLDFFGSFRLEVLTNIQFFVSGFTKGIIIGDGYFCSDNTYSDNLGKTYLRSQGDRFYVKHGVGKCEIVVFDSYNAERAFILTGQIISGDLSFLNYRHITNINVSCDGNAKGELKNLQSVNQFVYLHNTTSAINEITGDIGEFLHNSNPTQININNSRIYGDISCLSGFSSLTYLDISRTDVYGDISSLSALTGLTYISLWKGPEKGNLYGDIQNLGAMKDCTRFLFSGTNVNGTVESFAESLLGNGKTSECQCTFPETCTFNNKPLSDRITILFGSGSVTVKYTSTSVVLGTFDGTSWTYNS